MRSYISSTGRHRQPGGQNVPRRVHVTVMSSTTRTRPGANVQRHRVTHGAAVRAQFRGGEPAIYHDQPAAVPLGLVLQHGAEFTPRRVADSSCECMVLEHVSNGEVLDHDRLVLTNEPSGDLVQVIASPVGDTRTNLRDPATGFLPVRRTLGLPRESPMDAGQTDAVTPLMAGVCNLLSARQSQQLVKSSVYPGHRVGDGERPHGWVLAQQGHKPTPGPIPRHGYR